MHSLQMKLRECIVIPPPERPSLRFSVAFPERVCTRTAADVLTDSPAKRSRTVSPPPPLTARVEEEDARAVRSPPAASDDAAVAEEEEEEEEE